MTTGDVTTTEPQVKLYRPPGVEGRLARGIYLTPDIGDGSLSADPRWLLALRDGLGHDPYLLEAVRGERTVGLLGLCLVRSRLFGRYLVSLPYLNSGGVRTSEPDVAARLIDQAVALAAELQVRHLELRHETECPHADLPYRLTTKVHLRLTLPATREALWDGFTSKLKNQLRKGEKQGFSVRWGGTDDLRDFYAVFSRNMRDLGTPVFGRRLFASIADRFADQAEYCVLTREGQPLAAALLLHGSRVTEVPSASSLREYNSTNANMHLYWHLLQRAIERGSEVFDFGRSSQDSGTYRFKAQWGARPSPAIWQYHSRTGEIGEMRPENARYRLAIRVWKRLPVWLTRLLGPPIVRGIP